MTAMKRSNATGNYFSIAELKFYNASSEEISTTGATFTDSSSLSGYPVSNALDGSNSTLWHVDGSPSSAWIQVQFPSAVSISAFSITPRSDQNDRLDAFTLQASNGSSTWTTIYTGSNLASDWSQGTTKTFAPN